MEFECYSATPTQVQLNELRMCSGVGPNMKVAFIGKRSHVVGLLEFVPIERYGEIKPLPGEVGAAGNRRFVVVR